MRLFVGIPLPPGPAFAEVTRDLLGAAPAARPVPAGSWHVTLRFLGEVLDPAPVAAALQGAVAGRPALPAVVEGLGAFPDAKRAHVAWAGVRAPGIENLAAAVEAATAAFADPPAEHGFVAHATLARLPRPVDLRALVDRHRATLFGSGVLGSVVLFRSRLGPAGPEYGRLAELPLRGEA